MKRVSVFGAKNGQRCDITWVRVLVITLGLAGFVMPATARALSEQEAAKVVQLLEALQGELGDFAYDDELAGDWFEQDAESQGLIPAAGFTEESWKKALGDTFRGFLANVPEAEILQSFADSRHRLAETRSLTATQKQAALQLADEKQKQVLQLRAEGQMFAKAAQPVSNRMRALSGGLASRE